VQNFRRLAVAVAALVYPIVTGSAVAWADPAQGEPVVESTSGASASAHPASEAPIEARDPVIEPRFDNLPSTRLPPIEGVDDPYAPHATNGTIARFGTAVGFLYNQPIDTLAIGISAAVGQRWGRLTIESEFDWMSLRERGQSSLDLGNAERLGALARLDVIRLGPRYVGGNSLLSFYVEGGGAVAWDHWYQPSFNQDPRPVPDNTKRVEGQVGFGLALDHRLQEPVGFPKRIGWFLGWRLAFSPEGTAGTTVACRAESCDAVIASPPAPRTWLTRSMLFQSSMAVTW
jgi:hypothetical protein